MAARSVSLTALLSVLMCSGAVCNIPAGQYRADSTEPSNRNYFTLRLSPTLWSGSFLPCSQTLSCQP